MGLAATPYTKRSKLFINNIVLRIYKLNNFEYLRIQFEILRIFLD